MAVRRTGLMAVVAEDPCAYCGHRASSRGRSRRKIIDHIVPRSRGGADTLDNYTAACEPCNLSKRDVSLLGFLLWRAYRRDHAELLGKADLVLDRAAEMRMIGQAG